MHRPLIPSLLVLLVNSAAAQQVTSTFGSGTQFNAVEMAHCDAMIDDINAIVSPGTNDVRNDWDAFKASGGKVAHLEGGAAEHAGLGGMCDGTNIFIDLDDKPSAPELRTRLYHELQHWRHGTNGRLGPCEHSNLYLKGWYAAYFWCSEGHTIPCRQFERHRKAAASHAAECAAAGGTCYYNSGGNPGNPPSCCTQ